MEAIYWCGKAEAELARYQQAQVGNTCAAHAVSAGINLAFGCTLDGRKIGRQAYAKWWRGWANPLRAGIPPYAQINLLNYLRKANSLNLETRHYSWNPERWREALAQPDRLLLITFYWLARPAPLAGWLKNWPHPHITYGPGDDDQTQTNGVFITGHTMLLAACDPQHLTRGGKPRPWGFINSWISGGKYLYWMADEDLRFPRQAVQILF